MTLVELLIVIVLFGVISAIVSTELISTQRTQRNVAVRAQDLANIQVAIEDMTKLIATAARRPTTGTPDDAIVTATANTFTFYGYNLVGKAPSKISFYVDANNKLWESVATANQCTSTLPSDWTYATPRTRVLATNVSSTVQLFTYHSQVAASPVPTSYAGPTLALSGTPAALPSAQYPNLDSVEINLSVDLPSSPDIPSAAVTAQVAMPNLLVPSNNTPGDAC